MFAVLIATITTALAALVMLAPAQRRRAPRSIPHQRHPARGMGAALLLLCLSAGALAVAFTSAGVGNGAGNSVEPRTPWAIVPSSPVGPASQLETLSTAGD